MTLSQHIGQRIQAFRRGSGGRKPVTQRELGHELGIASNTISRWEAGAIPVGLDELERLASIFRVPLITFFASSSGDRSESVEVLIEQIRSLNEEEQRQISHFVDFLRYQRDRG